MPLHRYISHPIRTLPTRQLPTVQSGCDQQYPTLPLLLRWARNGVIKPLPHRAVLPASHQSFPLVNHRQKAKHPHMHGHPLLAHAPKCQQTHISGGEKQSTLMARIPGIPNNHVTSQCMREAMNIGHLNLPNHSQLYFKKKKSFRFPLPPSSLFSFNVNNFLPPSSSFF